LAACALAGVGARSAFAGATARPAFSVRVEAERSGLKFGLSPGGRLRSGDRLQAIVSADRDVFVNVVQYFADGSATVLYPVDESGFLRGGATLRIPREGFWLQLDDAVGEEHLYFVVSSRPLGDVDRVVAATIERVRASAGDRAAGSGKRVASDRDPTPEARPAAAAPTPSESARRPGPAGATMAPEVVPPSPLPEGFDLRNRGLVRVAGPDGAVVELDEEGLAIHRFSFFHDPG
jgi:hypothetical protein